MIVPDEAGPEPGVAAGREGPVATGRAGPAAAGRGGPGRGGVGRTSGRLGFGGVGGGVVRLVVAPLPEMSDKGCVIVFFKEIGQNLGTKWVPGCESFAGKLRNKWEEIAGTKFTKPGDHF